MKFKILAVVSCALILQAFLIPAFAKGPQNPTQASAPEIVITAPVHEPPTTEEAAAIAKDSGAPALAPYTVPVAALSILVLTFCGWFSRNVLYVGYVGAAAGLVVFMTLADKSIITFGMSVLLLCLIGFLLGAVTKALKQGVWGGGKFRKTSKARGGAHGSVSSA